MQSMIPVSTGLARGIERLLPELAGRIDAKAIRIPVANVSTIELVTSLARPADRETINALLRDLAAGSADRIGWTQEPHASIDFVHSPQSAIIDGSQTRLLGEQLLKIFVWFDNRWGFANRMVDIAAYWGRRLPLAGQEGLDGRRHPLEAGRGGDYGLQSGISSRSRGGKASHALSQFVGLPAKRWTTKPWSRPEGAPAQ